MTHCKLSLLPSAVLGAPLAAQSPSDKSCAALAGLKINGVEITKVAPIPAGTTVPPPYPNAPVIDPLPAPCRVDGVINRRRGVDGQEFGIGFALSLPDKSAWNGDFMMQGGGGGNGVVAYPAGANYSGEKVALAQGFAVASTDTGHKAKNGAFDFSFMRDQQAYLDFAYQANAEVAEIAKQFILHSYARPRHTTILSAVDKEALRASDPLVEPESTNLSTFSGSGGKLIFFHGDSDPWFSRSTRSVITNHLPQPTAAPRRFPNGAACSSSPAWRTAPGVPA